MPARVPARPWPATRVGCPILSRINRKSAYNDLIGCPEVHQRYRPFDADT